MISLNEAREKRITKVRLPHWANKSEHLELHITPDGLFGPWAKLHSYDQVRQVPFFGPEWDFDALDWEPFGLHLVSEKV